MNWIKIKNNTKIDLNKIPCLRINELREEIISQSLRPIAFFGKNWGYNKVRLFVVLADDTNGFFMVSSALFEENEKSYESLTPTLPSFHIFEREFYENFGIEPINHPWLKPVRKNQEKYEFFEMEGEEVHQVAVGPIHAGVIEPGHFRFMCNGENVYHLEIMLGYQNKGAEELLIKSPSNQLAESIVGDSVIAYNTAYSQIMETLSDIKITKKAQLIRMLALEMERAAVHIGDMGALAGDVAYLMGASVFGVTRTLVINTMLEFSGSRFGRGLIKVGGVNFDITEEKIKIAKETFSKVIKDVDRMAKTMLKNTSVMSRFEKKGYVSEENAKKIGLVGLVARASGVNLDSRFDFPNEWIKKFELEKSKHSTTGDVLSRFKLRYKEVMTSFSIIQKCFKDLEKHKNEEILTNLNKNLSKDSFAISVVEGWRGEIVHIAMTDFEGKLSHYKIKDPSFNNWYGLTLALRNVGISDFPLCNKSFNLSYSGNDL